MKHRLKYLLAVLIMLVPLAGIFIRPAPAAAAGEDYVFYNKNSCQSALTITSVTEWSKDCPDALIYARNGVFGNQLVTLTSPPADLENRPADQDKNTIMNNYYATYGYGTGSFYEGHYDCKNNTFFLLINLHDPTSILSPNVNAKSIDSNVYVLGVSTGRSDLNGAQAASRFSDCMPNNYNAAGTTTNYLRITKIPLYSALNNSRQNSWDNFIKSNSKYVPPAQQSINAAGGNGNGNTPSDTSLQCDLGITGFNLSSIVNALNPLNWLLCGIVKGMSLLVEGLDQGINNYLAVGTDSTSTDNPNQIFANPNGSCSSQVKAGTCADYQTAWASFRDIALGLLVIAGLIVVISQALGMEILDAYTIRKMLPRILIATIAVTLSWQLMRFAVILSNDLGYGVGKLISGPFHGIDQTIHVGGANGLLATVAAALGGILLDIFGILAFVGTAALAVLITFAVLTLRQIVIILLAIVSPIAIIAYVLPNTQRLYKFWWESFSKVLLMFPLIVAFITVGHVFSAIAANQSGSGLQGFFNQTVAFIAYFGPYFAVPMTFRFAGSIMGGIGNAVHARGEGMRRALAGVRSNRMKYNAHRLKMGTRFEGRLPGTRRLQNGVKIPFTNRRTPNLNEVTKGIGTGFRGRFGLGKTGKEARAQATAAAAEEAAQAAGIKAIAGKNDYNRMMVGGSRREGERLLRDHIMAGGDTGTDPIPAEEEIQSRVDAAHRAVMAAGGYTAANSVAAFHNMARDGTAIRDPKDLATLAAHVGRGNQNLTYTSAVIGAREAKGSARPDLSPDAEVIGAQAFEASDRIYGGNLYTGSRNPDTGNIEELTEDQLAADSDLAAFGNTQDYEWNTQARGRSLRRRGTRLAEIFNNDEGLFTEGQVLRAGAQIQRVMNSRGMGASNKVEAVVKALGDAPERLEKFRQEKTGSGKQITEKKIEKGVEKTITRDETWGDRMDEIGANSGRGGGPNTAQIDEMLRQHEEQ